MKAEWTNKDTLTSSETTKAILVIDMPKDCFTCELGGSKVCIGGCPLKPMPEKREPKEEWLNKYHRDEFADGWNACLEELEK